MGGTNHAANDFLVGTLQYEAQVFVATFTGLFDVEVMNASADDGPGGFICVYDG